MASSLSRGAVLGSLLVSTIACDGVGEIGKDTPVVAHVAKTPPRPFRDADVIELAFDDVESNTREADRPFVRYVSFANLFNAELPESRLAQAGAALSKVLASVSWVPELHAAFPVDTANALYRIDLRHYGWDASQWEEIAREVDYPITPTGEVMASLRGATGTETPIVRGDWLIDEVSRPPLYDRLLELPGTVDELEELLGVEYDTSLDDPRTARAGFQVSGVSQNNRIIERHAIDAGAYWKSYDFSSSDGRQNIFDHPLGPTSAVSSPERAFQSAGGEIIFSLPNGLQGYMLANGKGQKLDEAPIAIVSDPQRPDGVVVNGISCMSCHTRGMNRGVDEIRRHVAENAAEFASTDVVEVLRLYRPSTEVDLLLDQDSGRFTVALDALGISPDAAEPIVAAVLGYEAPLSLRTVAVELGVTYDDLVAQITSSDALYDALGELLSPQGTLSREEFRRLFPRLALELNASPVAQGP
jgi:hypothetical protein